MYNDFKFSKDYVRMFKDAAAVQNTDLMQEIFNQVITEFPGQTSEFDQKTSVAMGQAIAEKMNIQLSQDPTARGGKKV